MSDMRIGYDAKDMDMMDMMDMMDVEMGLTDSDNHAINPMSNRKKQNPDVIQMWFSRKYQMNSFQSV